MAARAHWGLARTARRVTSYLSLESRSVPLCTDVPLQAMNVNVDVDVNVNVDVDVEAKSKGTRIHHKGVFETQLHPNLRHPASGVRFSSSASGAVDLASTPPPPSPEAEVEAEAEGEEREASLTPARVVEQLDRHIVGQAQAKRAVAIALRNRWRRRQIEGPMKAEIVPKNILMIGPTGCGKTEIARRLAKLTDAPFVKVEATKFTEVGFHGRDVDQIIRDLLENAIQLQRTKMQARVAAEVERTVESKILDTLIGAEDKGGASGQGSVRSLERMGQRETFRSLYRRGALDERKLQMDLPMDLPSPAGAGQPHMGLEFGVGASQLENYMKQLERAMRGQRMERKELTVAKARDVLKLIETEKLLTAEAVVKEAIEVTESEGIVFLDEIDKIVSSSNTRHGPDVSSEGVQRDLLPIIEGSVVSTRHGNVSTEHILFICSGAFHSVKPSDMLAELQGRLPIRVELKGLSQQDLFRILTEPETNILRQQQMLMATEGINLVFTDAAIEEIAATAAEVNRSLHNIGARRLHTVLERVMEDLSFYAPERSGQTIVIDKEDVEESLEDLRQRQDLSQFIL